MSANGKQQTGRMWVELATLLPWLIALVAPALLVAGCDGSPQGPEVPWSVAVAPETLTLAVGQSRALAASARYPNGNDLPAFNVAWSSSDTAVAAVDSAGKVTARRAGQARVTASTAGKQGHMTLTVQAAAPAVARVDVEPQGQLRIRAGSMQQLRVRTWAGDGTELFGRPVAWTSSDSLVARVDPGHLLKGGRIGWASLTATVEGQSAIRAVEVLSQVARIDVEPAELVVAVGEVGRAHAYARDEAGNLLNKAARWSSTKNWIATVEAPGRVTGVATGTGTIIAEVEGTTAELPVYVDRWKERALLSADGAAPPVLLFQITQPDSVGTGTAVLVHLRAGRFRLLAGGPGLGRYEQSFDVAIARDGQPVEYGQLVFPGTWSLDLLGNVVLRTVNDELLPSRRLPDGRIEVTGSGVITIAGQEVKSQMKFLYENPS